MKRTNGRSLFWSRLLGLLITFAIVAVLVVGGVKNLTGELSAAYDALAASQYHLGLTQSELAATQNELARAHDEINSQHDKLVAKAHVLRQTAHILDVARNQINRLTVERDDLKRGLGEAVNALVESEQLRERSELERREAESALRHYRLQPKLSMIVTSERVLKMSERERFAASQVRMFAEGENGVLFYDGQEALHEMEKHLYYAERTQMVLTQTGPGDDVLRCFSQGCAMVLAAQSSAMQMEAYAYQSQYSSAEMLMVDGRRGRRPGWRR